MPYRTQKHYNLDPQILFSPNNANALNGAYVRPESISDVGGVKKILAGSWLAGGNRVLPRANTIENYVSGASIVKVDNPWAFLVGDVLYEIGDDAENQLLETQAVNNATQQLGTVTAIDAGVAPMEINVNPSAVAIGDIYNVQIEEILISFTATSTNVEDVVQGLYDELVNYKTESNISTIDQLEYSYSPTSLIIKAKQQGIIFTSKANVSGAGAIAVTTVSTIGNLTITPAAGNNNHNIGAKIGAIDIAPIGIFGTTYYLSTEDDQEIVADVSAYDTANIYKNAMVYLDGSLVSSMPTLKYIPAYGS